MMMSMLDPFCDFVGCALVLVRMRIDGFNIASPLQFARYPQARGAIHTAFLLEKRAAAIYNGRDHESGNPA